MFWSSRAGKKFCIKTPFAALFLFLTLLFFLLALAGLFGFLPEAFWAFCIIYYCWKNCCCCS